MIFGEYRMRAIEKEDLELILEWRNSERIHSMMLTPHKIEWEEHKNWFENIVSSQEPPLHFVFEYQNKPLGYIGYTQVDFINKRCSPGGYIGNVLEAPIDAGVVLIYMSIAYPLDYLGFNKLSTIVFKNNKKAYKMNRFFGYEEEGLLKEHFLKNEVFVDAYMLGILKAKWELNKAEMIDLIDCDTNERQLISKVYGGGVLFLTNNINTLPLFDWLEKSECVVIYSNKIYLEMVEAMQPSIIISYNYQFLIAEDIIQYMGGNIVNLHSSLLPWNRGSNPNFWSFIENTPKGVSIHLIDEKLDTGNIIVQKEVVFDEQKETFVTSYEKLNSMMTELFKENWQMIKNKNYTTYKQIGKGSYHTTQDLSNFMDGRTVDWHENIYAFKQRLKGLVN